MNGVCDADLGETCETCAIDCGECPPECGDDSCDFIIDEDCQSCPADCGPCCGDNNCLAEHGETCATCPADCGSCCGNDDCEADLGEDCGTCAADCGACPQVCGDGICDFASGEEDCEKCVEDCACEPGQECQYGQCCQADCDGKSCGPDGCGGSCGDCGGGETCTPEGQCIGCQPDCDGKACGADGCGGVCGTCGVGEVCVSGACEVQGGSDSCADILSCAFNCQDQTCLEGCTAEADTQAMDLWSDLMTCIVNVCGADQSPACWLAAAQVTCAAQYAACSGDN